MRRRQALAVVSVLLLLLGACSRSQPGADLVDVQQVIPDIVVDLKYATADNFTGQVLYEVPRCFLRRATAERLARVQARLRKQGLGLKIWDGYRPRSVQWKMWKLVPDSRYVADPRKGSRHNRGAAVDVTLVDSTGRELEMPTGFDDFTEKAHRDYQGCSETARRNRALLEAAMTAEGFVPLPTEWWHFDDPEWRKYELLDVSLSELARRVDARQGARK
ncbi:MAG: D-alanyl-D-alanine dipeptidase [Calditrichaeota bacterium]|nr:D-alanyl-D-alanine dipeptidase [Calditrichota bacterium]